MTTRKITAPRPTVAAPSEDELLEMLRRSVMDDGDPGFETTDTEAEVFDREHPLADIPDLDYEIDLYGAAELVMAGIERLDLCEKIMAFENGELEDLEIFELFQGLCDTGMIFDLQGSYQRLAIRLAADGLVHLHHRDAVHLLRRSRCCGFRLAASHQRRDSKCGRGLPQIRPHCVTAGESTVNVPVANSTPA